MMSKIKFPNLVGAENKIHHEEMEVKENIMEGENKLRKGMKKY